jgi:hypothetical protein
MEMPSLDKSQGLDFRSIVNTDLPSCCERKSSGSPTMGVASTARANAAGIPLTSPGSGCASCRRDGDGTPGRHLLGCGKP